jgi:hypothetical protein
MGGAKSAMNAPMVEIQPSAAACGALPISPGVIQRAICTGMTMGSSAADWKFWANQRTFIINCWRVVSALSVPSSDVEADSPCR